MRRNFLFVLLAIFLSGCTHVFRVQMEVLKPPSINVHLKKLRLEVKEESLKNEFVEIKDFKGEVEKFIKNELESQGGIKVAEGNSIPELTVEYKASLSHAYSYYDRTSSGISANEQYMPYSRLSSGLIPVKIISMDLCFTIKEIKYHRCMKERMKFPDYESSVFALYAVLQRMTSSLLSDISYQRKRMMHYLLR